MNIQTKYSIGDKAYFFYERRVMYGEITEIKVELHHDWANFETYSFWAKEQKWNGKKDKCFNISLSNIYQTKKEVKEIIAKQKELQRQNEENARLRKYLEAKKLVKEFEENL